MKEGQVGGGHGVREGVKGAGRGRHEGGEAGRGRPWREGGSEAGQGGEKLRRGRLVGESMHVVREGGHEEGMAEMKDGRQVGGEHGMREGVSEGGREDREGRNGGGEAGRGRAWHERGS